MNPRKGSISRSKMLAIAVAVFFGIETIIGGFGLLPFLNTANAASSCTSYPCSSSITINSYNGVDSNAIADLQAGKISAYDFQLTPVQKSSLGSAFNYMSVPNSLYEVLVNPENTTWAGVSSFTGSSFNPFYYPQVRAALNYVLDRSYLVDTLLGGAGVPVLSVYGTAPDSLTVANGTALYSSYLTYNFALANQTFYNTLSKVNGIAYVNGKYYYHNSVVQVFIIQRTDDPVRSQYAGFLGTQLTNLGFSVVYEAQNLAQVKVTAFVENPVNATGGSPPTPWNIYVGAYSNVYLLYGDQLQVCFDGANCSGSPYSDPTSNDVACGCNVTLQTPPDVVSLSLKLDQLNNQILSGSYTNVSARAAVLTNYTQLEIQMGVNDWLATGLNVYGFNPTQIAGLTASFVTSPILNTQSLMTMYSANANPLTLGARYLTQYNMNPVGGYGDAYSADLLAGTFPGAANSPVGYGPSTGYPLPFGITYSVDNMTSGANLPIPSSALNYNATNGWYNVTSSGGPTTATSVFTYNFADLINHDGYGDGENVSLADTLYTYVIAKNVTYSGSPIYDSSSAATPSLELPNILGIQVLNSTAIKVYSSYFFFDPNDAALTVLGYLTPFRNYGMPWTMYVAMSDLVATGKDAWSQTGASAKSIPWLTLAGSGANGNPTDITNLETDLGTRSTQGYIPAQLTSLESKTGVTFNGLTSVGTSYTDAKNFLTTYNNGFIGYGPYYVSTFSGASPQYAVLTVNPMWHLTPYLAPALFATPTVTSVSVTVPATVSPGSTITMTALSTVIGQTTANPQSNVNIVVQLVNSTAVVSQAKLTSGAGGTASFTVPSLPTGAYTLTIYASSSNSTEIIPQSYSLILSSGSSTTSTTSTGSTPPPTTGTTSTTTSPTSSNSTTLYLAAGVVVVIIVVAAAVLLLRRRPRST